MGTLTQSPVVATLGGSGTVADQATGALLARMPELGPVEIWAAVSARTVDSAVLTSETSNTGLEAMAKRLLAAGH